MNHHADCADRLDDDPHGCQGCEASCVDLKHTPDGMAAIVTELRTRKTDPSTDRPEESSA